MVNAWVDQDLRISEQQRADEMERRNLRRLRRSEQRTRPVWAERAIGGLAATALISFAQWIAVGGQQWGLAAGGATLAILAAAVIGGDVDAC